MTELERLHEIRIAAAALIKKISQLGAVQEDTWPNPEFGDLSRALYKHELFIKEPNFKGK